MLILLALMAQTAPLAADTSAAAQTCAQVFSITALDRWSQMQRTSAFTYVAIAAAKAAPGNGTMFEQLNRVSEQISRAPMLSAGDAEMLAPQCDRRFPLARSEARASMPQDQKRRDLLCFAMLSVLQGAAEEIEKEKAYSGKASILTVLERLEVRLTDAELKKMGLETEQKFVAALGKEMLASLPLGNPQTIATACGATDL